jgi:phage virion morphogenesis protein
MAGTSIEIRVKDQGVSDLLTRLQHRIGNLRPALQVVGEIVVESIQRNFEEHQSPKKQRWKDLSPAYERWKTQKMGRNADDVLILSRDLMGSIAYKAYSDKVVIGTGPYIVYAAIHQFGGKTGRGHAATMPARPFMGVRDEDWPSIRSAIEAFLR